MSRTTGLTLSRAELAEISARVFGQRELTLSACAAGYSLDTLCETLVSLTSELPAVVAASPEQAFERQPDDADGNDVWSAGQIVSHLAQTTMQAIPFWEAITGGHVDPPGDAALSAIDARLLDREASVAAARDIADSSRKLADQILAAPALGGPASHFVLGMADGPAALLATCIHTASHIQQIQDLDTTRHNR